MENGSGSTPRQTFDSAYANLETTVRNFSREKLQYRETINSLQKKLESSEQALQQNNRVIQTLLTENEKLEVTHEEDQTARCAVDATVAAATMKQELLSRTIGEFECVEREILERYVAVGEFIDSLKIRQLQLYDWIDELKRSLQNETLHLTESEKRNEEVSNKYDMVLQQLNQAMNEKTHLLNDLAERQSRFDCLTSQMTELTNNLQQLEDKHISAENKNKENTENLKIAFEEQINQALNEKMALQQELVQSKSDIGALNSDIRDLTYRLQDLNAKIGDLETSNEDNNTKYKQTLEAQTMEASTVKMELQQELLTRQSEITCLQLEMSNKIQILKDNICESEKQNEEVNAKYGMVLQQVEQVNTEKAQMQNDLAERQSRIDCLTSEMCDLEKRNEEVSNKYDMVLQQLNQAMNEKTHLLNDLAERQSRFDCLTSQMTELTNNLQQLEDKHISAENKNKENTENLKIAFEEQINQALNEKMALQQELVQSKSDIGALNSDIRDLTYRLQDLNAKIGDLETSNEDNNTKYKQTLEAQIIEASTEKMELQQELLARQSEISCLQSQMSSEIQILKDIICESETRTVEMKCNYERDLEDKNNQALAEKIELQQRVVGLQSEIESLGLQKNELTQHLQDLNNKMSESEKRKSRRPSFQLPSSARRPIATEITNVPGILKRSSSERGHRMVQFNDKVDIRKYKTTVTISSSDSDSDEIGMQRENILSDKMKVVDPQPVSKKLRMTPTDLKTDSAINKSVGEKDMDMEIENSASPKFFKNRSSPLKTYNSCKSPRRPQSSSQH